MLASTSFSDCTYLHSPHQIVLKHSSGPQLSKGMKTGGEWFLFANLICVGYVVKWWIYENSGFCPALQTNITSSSGNSWTSFMSSPRTSWTWSDSAESLENQLWTDESRDARYKMHIQRMCEQEKSFMPCFSHSVLRSIVDCWSFRKLKPEYFSNFKNADDKGLKKLLDSGCIWMLACCLRQHQQELHPESLKTSTKRPPSEAESIKSIPGQRQSYLRGEYWKKGTTRWPSRNGLLHRNPFEIFEVQIFGGENH